MNAYIEEMRLKHWYKALIVFAGPFFTGRIFQLDLLSLLFAFVAFGLVSSSIYVINDIKDAEKDRLHPKKRNRPIASGRISKKNALLFAILLFSLSSIFAYLSNFLVLLSTFSYFVLFILYTFYLKKMAVIDSFAIATGYLLRALAGCWATGIEITPWFYLVIFSFAVYLAFCKRYTEVKLANKEHKENLGDYAKIAEIGIAISGSTSLALYSLYAMQKNSLIFTVPLAFLGIMLHLRETAEGREVHESLASPEVALTFLAFIAAIFFLLYLNI